MDNENISQVKLTWFDKIFKPQVITLPNGHQTIRCRSRAPFIVLLLAIAIVLSLNMTGFDLGLIFRKFSKLMDLMADVLALHTDYSLWESYLRLDAVEKIRFPDFPKTLFDNASCGYCRSHQYELARYWYAPRMHKAAERLAKAVAADDRKVKLYDDSEAERATLMERPLESLRPVLPRDAAQYRATLLAIADMLEGKRP